MDAGQAAPRRLNLIDAAVLMIALAAGLVPARWTGPRLADRVRAINWTLVRDPVYVRGTLLGQPSSRWTDSVLAWTASGIRGIVVGPERSPYWTTGLTRGVPGGSPWGGLLVEIGEETRRLLFPPLLWLTFAVLLLRIRRPRPPWGALACQPGLAACAAAALAATLAVWVEATTVVVVPVGAIAAAVAGAWLVQFLGRWRRAERSWLDRLGRAVGWGWLLVGALGLM